MRRLFLAVIALLTGCSPEPEIIQRSKTSLSSQLKNPETVKFQNVVICSANKDMVTGEYDAENSFGAFNGFSQFYAYKGTSFTGAVLEPIKVSNKSFSYKNQLMLACYDGADPDFKKFMASVNDGTAKSIEQTIADLEKQRKERDVKEGKSSKS